jgi:hypothetical protein
MAILFKDKAQEAKKRSVLGVHEHLSPTSNAAIGQKGHLWIGTRYNPGLCTSNA